MNHNVKVIILTINPYILKVINYSFSVLGYRLYHNRNTTKNLLFLLMDGLKASPLKSIKGLRCCLSFSAVTNLAAPATGSFTKYNSEYTVPDYGRYILDVSFKPQLLN